MLGKGVGLCCLCAVNFCFFDGCGWCGRATRLVQERDEGIAGSDLGLFLLDLVLLFWL